MIDTFDATDLPGDFIALCFAIFVVFWAVTAFTTKRTVARRGRWTGPFFLIVLGYMLLRVGFVRAPWMNAHLWPRTLLTGLVGDALALAGLAVMLWARVTLGRNWSGGVVLKEEHELVTGGPYRFVRHPIYSGLLLLTLGWAVWRARTVGFVALAATLLLFWTKSRAEEQLMIEHFGDAYVRYKARVKALIPYLVTVAILATPLALAAPATASCPWTNSVRFCASSFATHTEPAFFDSVQSCGVTGGDCQQPLEVAVYDIPGGLVRVAVAGGSCGGGSPAVTSHDDYWIVGPASADPIQCTAQLALAGGGGGCGSSGTATFTAYNLPVTASFRTGPVAPSKCGLQTPLPPALYRPISQLVGVPFDLSIAVSAYNGPVGYSDFAYLTAQLSFTGLPPGYSVVSCNGYGATGPTPASASSWGRLKGIYR